MKKEAGSKKELKLLKEIEELKKKLANNDKIITQQTKMASIGEMVGNITHQWRQPLMELSSILMSIEARVKLGKEVSDEFLLDGISRSYEVMKYMSQTIEDFRKFSAKEKEKVGFMVSDQIKTALGVISTVLENKDIKLNVLIKSNPTITGYKNEYAQVLINLLANAKDILIIREVEDPQIEMKVYQDSEYCITEITDNGGGIEIDPVEKIFDLYFTSGKEDGTGIGLFMAKLIVEKNMQGSLQVSNVKDGAKFTIKIPLHLES